jgi:AhpD family alkylhydroperoxidase
MARIDLPPGPGEDRERMWRLRPELGEAAEALSRIVQERSIIPVREHEAARIRIAHINGCDPCSEARAQDMEAYGVDESFYEDVDYPERRARYTERERLAIEFAERFAAGRDAFDGAFWADLRAAFRDDEIVDLGVSVAKWLALGRINAVFDLAVSCPIRIAPSRANRSVTGAPASV